MALDALDMEAIREGQARSRMAKLRRETRNTLSLATGMGVYLRKPYRTARGSGTKPAQRPASGNFAA